MPPGKQQNIESILEAALLLWKAGANPRPGYTPDKALLRTASKLASMGQKRMKNCLAPIVTKDDKGGTWVEQVGIDEMHQNR